MSRRIVTAGAAAIAALFVAIRWPLFTEPGLVLGWNSDAALFGLMARAMADGSDMPVFFWGQPYLGTFTSLLTVVVAAGQEIGPLALRIAASIEVALAILFWTLGIAKAFGVRTAIIVAAWLAAGPYFLFHFTIAPIGAEQLFLIAGLLFCFVVRSPMRTASSWFTAGAIFGCGMWLHQGVMFPAAAIAVALFVERLFTMRRFACGVAGAVVGYLPAAVVLLRHDVRLYSRAILPWNVPRVVGNIIETFRSDLWLLLTAPTAVGVFAGCVLIAFAALAMKERGWNRGRSIAGWTIVFCLAFWMLSTYPYGGAVRYIVPALPMLYAFAAAGMLAWWSRGGVRRWFAIAAIAGLVVWLPATRLRDAVEVAEGAREQYTNWPGGFDPRPALGAIRRGGYEVCYGAVWVAHKFEFITDPTVRFVVVASVHRTLPQSLSLVAQPGPKCFLENDGRVWELSADQEREQRRGVELRARKAGLLP